MVQGDKENMNPNMAELGTRKGKKPLKEIDKIGTIRSHRGLKVNLTLNLN